MANECRSDHESNQELDEENSPVATKIEPKMLTNIYYDCLERIFDFLDLESLMNVAGTCKRLKIAAVAKFADDHGKKQIQMHPIGSGYKIDDKVISIYGLKNCLAFLRCCGSKTLKMDYNGTFADKRSDYLDRFINQYCADLLISIIFCNKRPFSSKCFAKPFKNVNCVSIFGGDLENQLPTFVNLFPNLSSLIFCGPVTFDDNAIQVTFPHLKCLYIDVYNSTPDCLTIKKASKLLHANRQLQSLKIQLEDGNITLEKLLDMIIDNTSILKLFVWGGDIIDIGIIELNSLAHEHPLIEELRLLSLFTADDAITLTHQLNSLKRFQFLVNDQTEYQLLLNQLEAKWKYEVTPLSDGEPRFIEISRSIE